MSNQIRVGFIGAGTNTRNKHLPGFINIPGVELAGVCNSRAESTDEVAREFSIKKTYTAWQEMIADPDIDAVMIGTWPNHHAEMSIAALEAGKHVLTEARMAATLNEAQQMLAVAEQHPELKAMVVPSPFGLQKGDYIRNLIHRSFLGELREIIVIGADSSFADFSQFLHPRQDQNLSGINTLMLGILHETLTRWVPEPEQVFAQSQIFEPTRPIENQPDETGHVTVPDSLQVLTQLPGGARAIYHMSGVCLFGPGLQIHIYGSEGSLKVAFQGEQDILQTARIGDDTYRTIELSDEKMGGWQVEEDFIAAIRGEKPVELNDFATALKYMEFTEAVSQSQKSNQPVRLPLK